jgi:hypothetical protein
MATDEDDYEEDDDDEVATPINPEAVETLDKMCDCLRFPS